MIKKAVEIVTGDLKEKKEYHVMMRRANRLPKEYRVSFKNIQKYLYVSGSAACSTGSFSDLLDLFEAGVLEGKSVHEIIGKDAAQFCDELSEAAGAARESPGQRLNREIREYMENRGKEHV